MLNNALLRLMSWHPRGVFELRAIREPQITASRALELYWDLAADQLHGKSDDQMRRWKNPRIKAINNFVAVVGDKALADITGDDMLDFRGWWLERIETQDLSPNSANKDLIHLGNVLKTVNRMKRLNLVLPLSDLSFKEAEPIFKRLTIQGFYNKSGNSPS